MPADSLAVFVARLNLACTVAVAGGNMFADSSEDRLCFLG